MSANVASTITTERGACEFDEEGNILFILTPKFVGNTIVLPDPPHIDNGPVREANLELLAGRPCAPLHQVDNEFLHIAVTGIVKIVNQYNCKHDASHSLSPSPSLFLSSFTTRLDPPFARLDMRV